MEFFGGTFSQGFFHEAPTKVGSMSWMIWFRASSDKLILFLSDIVFYIVLILL